jgi:hypothetical protein
MENKPLHKAQISILYALRHTQSARYSQLMQPTGLESDVFKFHVRKLVHYRLVEKLSDGSYHLTAQGKEVANNINGSTQSIQKQPKLSVLLVVSRQNTAGQTEYLLHQRLRNPFFHYWGFLSGPIAWGEPAEHAAQRELQKQTGLEAQFTVHGFYRQRDFIAGSTQLLEDKLFTVVCAQNPSGELGNTWKGGASKWLTKQEIALLPHLFAATLSMIAMIQNGETYAAYDSQLPPQDY